jgi:hypothetical protein
MTILMLTYPLLPLETEDLFCSMKGREQLILRGIRKGRERVWLFTGVSITKWEKIPSAISYFSGGLLCLSEQSQWLF